jgi:hypothetical protein
MLMSMSDGKGKRMEKENCGIIRRCDRSREWRRRARN